MPIITIVPISGNKASGTFIEQYGYVQYPAKRSDARKILEQRYSADRPCEIIGCDLRKALIGIARKVTEPDYQWCVNFPDWLEPSLLQYQDFLASYPNPEKEYTEMITFALRNGRSKQQRMRQPAMLFDHCHKHGWIRGVICNSCNTIIGKIEASIPSDRSEPFRPLYEKYLRNCTECLTQIST
jgi:hypothetical protein